MVAFLRSWAWEPVVLVGIAAGAGLYVLGWRRLAATRRGGAAVARWRAAAYFAGLILVGVALLSPIATFTSLFFFMHMIQHMLLISAAPLLLLGSPLVPLLWALPRGPRRELGLLFVPSGWLQSGLHFLTHPVFTLVIFVATLAVWHVPSFYDEAQGHNLIHETEHLMFLGASGLYWWPVIHPWGGKRRLSYGMGIFYIAPNMVVQNAIGMVLTFVQQPVYQTYLNVPRLWNISVVLDQQLAGAVMGLLGAAINIVALSALVALFLRGDQAAARARKAARRHATGASGPVEGSR